MKTEKNQPCIPQTELEWSLYRLIHGEILPEPLQTAYLNRHNPKPAAPTIIDGGDHFTPTEVRAMLKALAAVARDETGRFDDGQRIDAIEHYSYLDGTFPPKQLPTVHCLLARAFLRKCGVWEEGSSEALLR
jgi:hypothetical protein